MIIINEDEVIKQTFTTVFLMTLVMVLLVLVASVTKYGPDFQVWLHRNDVRTVKNAHYKLLKQYTNDKEAHYIYKLSWDYSNKTEYADNRYKAQSTGNGSHTYQRVSTSYSNTEPIPDNANSYKLENH